MNVVPEAKPPEEAADKEKKEVQSKLSFLKKSHEEILANLKRKESSSEQVEDPEAKHPREVADKEVNQPLRKLLAKVRRFDEWYICEMTSDYSMEYDLVIYVY